MKILILGGFLGSGKTTLLLQMARDMAEHSTSESEHKVIILENEVGQDGIDDKLLGSSGFQVSSLFNGCICCTLSGEIIGAVVDIEKKYNPEWLIIETTGLAYPGLIRRNLQEAIGKDAFICTIVDVSRWKRFLIPMHELLKGQVECADLVLLNKADLVDAEVMDKVESDVHQFREGVPCIRTSGLAAVDPDIWQKIREGCA
ncbi:MAG TPA: cobalamin biosynthesis protein P47K [Candidatus Scatomonas pullistercoris]|uniref:Cobalamin biosynthesis protein P47K n=1 Tax=Candidatus Scatomonas pullistercoris TaxID=2840920 RepID=A0A9D1P497_9FIRM|nr:cobalamin biosynthesis protein P47K [Candidatus Scatomonas pullistercoris]